MIKRCPICKKEFKTDKKRQIYCSSRCFGLSKKSHKNLLRLPKGIAPKWITRPWDGKNRPELSGKNHPMWDKHHTEEARRKIKEARKKQGRINVGQEHWNWKGGISSLRDRIYKSFKFRQWRSDIFTRDNYTCQKCGQKGTKLNAHHIKPFSQIIKENNIKDVEDALNCEELWNINNGITLCEKCHKKTENYGGRQNKFKK